MAFILDISPLSHQLSWISVKPSCRNQGTMLPKLDDNVIIVVVLTWWLFFIALEIRSNCHGLYKYVTNNDPTHKVLTQLLFRQNSFVLICKAGFGPKSTYSTELLLENNHCKCIYFQDSTAKNALFPKHRSNPIIRKKPKNTPEWFGE